MKITAELLIDAICGCPLGMSQEKCNNLTKLGYMACTGNQHGEAWEWQRDKLAELGLDELEHVYIIISARPARHGKAS